MRMSENDYVFVVGGKQLCRIGNSELITVTDVYSKATDGEHLDRRQRRMTGRVSVSANGQHGSDRAELMENVIAADVARMENELDAFERRVDTRPQ